MLSVADVKKERKRLQQNTRAAAYRKRQRQKTEDEKQDVQLHIAKLVEESNKWYLKLKKAERTNVFFPEVQQNLRVNEYHVFDMKLNKKEWQTMYDAVFDDHKSYIGQGMVSPYFVDLQRLSHACLIEH